MTKEVKPLDEIVVIGDAYPVVRLPLGLYSIDKAFGFKGIDGLPLRSVVELYGPSHSGKTTFAIYVASRVDPEGEIWYADIEGTLDKEYAKEVARTAGFAGTLRIADYTETKKGKLVMRPHEVQLQDTIEAMARPEVAAGILDSAGGFFTIVEAGKDLGERTMGQRARTIADASRWLMAGLRVVEDPKLFIYINHTHPNIGGRGFVTPGGETKTYIANTRVWIRVVDSDRPTATGNFLAEAKVQKLKHGGTHSERKGWIYFIPGYGVARGMTAVFDCAKLGLADLGAVVRLNGESHGRMRQLVAAEEAGEHEVFEPFHNALKGLDDD
jgi:RecA/RadA recombinase